VVTLAPANLHLCAESCTAVAVTHKSPHSKPDLSYKTHHWELILLIVQACLAVAAIKEVLTKAAKMIRLTAHLGSMDPQLMDPHLKQLLTL